MTGNDDTGNPARLPLAERARRGWLADEPGLPLAELIELEHPTGGEARQSFKSALKMAIAYGDLTAPEREYVPLPRKPRSVYELQALEAGANPVRTVEPFIEREAYRTWRAQCPASLLSPLSKTAKWLGAPSLPQGEPEPLPQGEPGKPELGAAESCKRKRVDALAEAIEAALEVLSPDGRLPTPARLFEYLLTQDTTGVVIPGDSKTVFYWIASNGNKQSADTSTIAKRLDRMKQGD